jgi:hypothetical protein
MPLTSSRSPWTLAVILSSGVAATTLVLSAQAPAPPPPQNPPPATETQGGPGRGGGRGRAGGGQDLTGIDFTKQPPVLAKTPEEQL